MTHKSKRLPSPATERLAHSSVHSFIRSERASWHSCNHWHPNKITSRLWVGFFSGFCFLRPAGLQQQLWESLGKKTPLTGRRRSRGSASEISSLHLRCCFPPYLVLSWREAGGGAVLLFGCLFLFPPLHPPLFYGLYSNSPRVKLFLEPPSVIISFPVSIQSTDRRNFRVDPIKGILRCARASAKLTLVARSWQEADTRRYASAAV